MSDVNRRGLLGGRGAIYASAIEFSLCMLAALIAIPLTLGAQGNNQAGTGDTEHKRILGIFTNHRTTDESMNRTKLTPGGKFDIAWHDATDRAIFVQSAILSVIGQATNRNPSYGPR